MKKVGEKIKELRIKAGLTQKQLGDLLHISYQAVSKWENNRGLPDPSLFPEIATILHTTVNELFYEEAVLNEETNQNAVREISEKSAYKPVKPLIIIISVLLAVVIASVAVLFSIITRADKNKTKLESASIIYNDESNLYVVCDYNGQILLFVRKYFFDGRKVMFFSDGKQSVYNYNGFNYTESEGNIIISHSTAEDFLSAIPDVYGISLKKDVLKRVVYRNDIFAFRLKNIDNLPIAAFYGFTAKAEVGVMLKDERLFAINVSEGKNRLKINYYFGYDFEFSLPEYINP